MRMENSGLGDGARAEELAEQMYRYLEEAAVSGRMEQTLRALPLMKRLHAGQARIGKEGRIPYIIHPLTVACQCFALGLADDEILPAALLHDVAEDCGAVLEDLPVSDAVKDSLARLTFKVREGESRKEAKERYYAAIAGSKKAVLVKVLDRCNNISTMAMGFSKQKMLEYLEETRRYVLPLLERMETEYPDYRKAVFLIRYHMLSVLESVDCLLTGGIS